VKRALVGLLCMVALAGCRGCGKTAAHGSSDYPNRDEQRTDQQPPRPNP
jgi:hypothetical protein